MKIALLTYHHPHRKTQDVLLRMYTAGWRPDIVIAAPFERTADAREPVDPVVHPEALSKALDLKYWPAPHTEGSVPPGMDVGVIAGARILPESMIKKFKVGVLNLHPAALPEVRGLDALWWSIWQMRPLAVTAHLIDHRVDAGRLLFRRPVPVRVDDTMDSMRRRLYWNEVEAVLPALEMLDKGDLGIEFPDAGPPNMRMNEAQKEWVRDALPLYVRRWAVEPGEPDR